MGIGLTMLVMFVLGFMAALIVDNGTERKWKEKQRRLTLRRKFERQMHDLRMSGHDC